MLRPVCIFIIRHAAAAASLQIGPGPRGPRLDVGDAAAALRGELYDKIDPAK